MFEQFLSLRLDILRKIWTKSVILLHMRLFRVIPITGRGDEAREMFYLALILPYSGMVRVSSP